MGAVGIIAAVALLRWVPRYSAFATTGSRSVPRRADVTAGTRAEPEQG
jgi:hypothetical protein